MEIKKVHCLFEQSGTWKNAFKSLGYEAEDYDVLNTYGETDNEVDLFSEIDKAYNEKESIFDYFCGTISISQTEERRKISEYRDTMIIADLSSR